MPYELPHPWPTTPREAVTLQESLRDQVIERGCVHHRTVRFGWHIEHTVAGAQINHRPIFRRSTKTPLAEQVCGSRAW